MKPLCPAFNSSSCQISSRAIRRYSRWQFTRLKIRDERILYPLLYLRRFLSDWLGVLLHGGRGGGRHAAVRLAVLFRREEAEAVPVLKRAKGQRQGHKRESDRYRTAGAAMTYLTTAGTDWLCSAHTHVRAHTQLWKLVVLLKAVPGWNIYGPILLVKNLTSHIPLTKGVFLFFDSCLFIYGCFSLLCVLVHPVMKTKKWHHFIVKCCCLHFCLKDTLKCNNL